MLFNSQIFLFVFLPLVLFICLWRPLIRWRAELLVAASFIFYGYSGLTHVVALIAEILIVFWMMRDISGRFARLRLAVAIGIPALGLIFFKYRGFLAANLMGAEGVRQLSVFQDLILPAGISFFTFHLLSFAIDRWSGKIPAMPTLRDFSLYICFFPQLVAGPILRWSDVSEPLSKLRLFRPALADVRACIGYMCWGLVLKVLLADGLAGVMDPLIKHVGALTPAATAYVVAGYSFEIYFDFYGYSLVAYGLGRLFGFRFPDNFRRPYESLNPKAFWRRWHITLSSWLRDYLYLKLGGNHAYTRNILIVFGLCGLWHGAGWNYVVWGLYHALLVIGYGRVQPAWDRLPALAQRGLTFGLVSLGWTLFLFDFSKAWTLLSTRGDVAVAGWGAWGLLAASAVVCFGVNVEKLTAAMDWPRPRAAAYSAALAVLAVAVVLYVDTSRDFIYFRF